MAGAHLLRVVGGLVSVFVLTATLSGCGVAQREAQQSQDAAISADLKAGAAALRQECAAKLETKQLDPIRDKIEFYKSRTDGPAPFSMLSNSRYPNNEEQKAIAIFAGLRDECTNLDRQRIQHQVLPSNVNRVMYDKLNSFSLSTARQTGDLLVALYQGKITYGEFAKKRAESSAASASAREDYLQAMQQADQQRRMQELQLAEQRNQSSMAAWSSYLQAVQAMQPHTVNLQTNCTSTRTGNFTNTTCQ